MELMPHFPLPALCGIVSLLEFKKYVFGPFISCAYRKLMEPPIINHTIYQDLCLVRANGQVSAKNHKVSVAKENL
jgi:hypothetical protein